MEGYATGLTVNQLTGDTVLVALSSVNLLSLASLVRERHPAQQLIIAADRDLNGDGQTKAAAAANTCQGIVALPPVFGDWNDAFMQQGEEATRSALQETVKAPAVSPFEQMSEAEFTAMSTSEKAMRVSEHYGHALAVMLRNAHRLFTGTHGGKFGLAHLLKRADRRCFYGFL